MLHHSQAKPVSTTSVPSTKILSLADVHDLRNASTTLGMAMQELLAGYRFDDYLGQQKLAAMERAVERLQTIAYNLTNE